MPASLLLATSVAAGIACGVFLDAAIAGLAPWLIAGAGLATLLFDPPSGRA